MKHHGIVILSIFFLFSCNSYAQNDPMFTRVEKILQLGRDSIIRIGFDKVLEHTDPDMNMHDFDKVTVAASKNSVWVSFQHVIKYIPMNSVYHYDIGVEITGGQVSMETLSNPTDFNPFKKDIPFFTPDTASEKNVLFVISAINSSDTTRASENKRNFIKNMDGYLIIRENENFYAIERVSASQESFYKIDKISGKLYDAEHNHLLPPPIDENEEDRLIEMIK